MINAIVYIFGGFFFGLALAALRLLKLERRNADLEARIGAGQDALTQMDSHFRNTAQEAVRSAHESFLLLAEARLKDVQKDGAHDLDKRQKSISELVDPIAKTLKEMDGKIETLGKAGTGLETQLKTFSDIQNRLRDETANLTRALRNPGRGGRWGEMQLQRTLEAMGMVEGTHFRKQVYTSVSGEGQQPDFVLDMPGGLHIVVDVKTPLDPYLEITGTDADEDQRAAATARLQKAFRGHLAELSRKEYWQRFDSPDFVVMYLPSEGLFSMAVSADPQLLEDAAHKKVFIVSPTTFMVLARIAHYGWQQKNLAQEAREIGDLGAELYKRVAVFGEHMQKLGNNLQTTIKTYNAAVGSLESKVLSGAKKLKERHVQTGGREIPDLSVIEEMPRLLAPSELEEEKKRA